MAKFSYEEEPIIVCRDLRYPIVELISPKNRKRANERVKNPNYVDSKYKLKELFAEFGITVNPKAMAYVHFHDYM